MQVSYDPYDYIVMFVDMLHGHGDGMFLGHRIHTVMAMVTVLVSLQCHGHGDVSMTTIKHNDHQTTKR